MDSVKGSIILSIAIIFFGLAIAGGTYAYFGASDEDANMSGNTLAISASIGVSTIRSGNLIPTVDNLITTSLNGSYPCEDARGYSLCSLYDITLTNTGPAINLDGYITSNNSTTYTTDHLKYRLYTYSSNTYKLVSDSLPIDVTSGSKNYIRNTNKKYSFSLSDGTSSPSVQHYYLVIWLSDIGDNQLEDVNKQFSGTIVFESSGGTIAAEFGSTVKVTLDPNGGTVSQTSVTVTPGSTYGVLPEPSRTGYTFLGWNGKNMFSPLTVGKAFDAATGNISSSSGSALTDFIPVDYVNNSSYRLKLSSDYRTMAAAYNENYEYMGRISGRQSAGFNIAPASFNQNNTNVGGTIRYIKIRIYQYEGLSGVISNINNCELQMEPGTTSTAYEPYYITSSTTVVQNADHTLTAIWQKN